MSTIVESDLHRKGISEVESELTDIFGSSGKQVVLLEFFNRYKVTVDDAIRRPKAFHTALYYLLGELGSDFVMGRIDGRLSRLRVTNPSL